MCLLVRAILHGTSCSRAYCGQLPSRGRLNSQCRWRAIPTAELNAVQFYRSAQEIWKIAEKHTIDCKGRVPGNCGEVSEPCSIASTALETFATDVRGSDALHFAAIEINRHGTTVEINRHGTTVCSDVSTCPGDDTHLQDPLLVCEVRIQGVHRGWGDCSIGSSFREIEIEATNSRFDADRFAPWLAFGFSHPARRQQLAIDPLPVLSGDRAAARYQAARATRGAP